MIKSFGRKAWRRNGAILHVRSSPFHSLFSSVKRKASNSRTLYRFALLLERWNSLFFFFASCTLHVFEWDISSIYRNFMQTKNRKRNSYKFSLNIFIVLVILVKMRKIIEFDKSQLRIYPHCNDKLSTDFYRRYFSFVPLLPAEIMSKLD